MNRFAKRIEELTDPEVDEINKETVQPTSKSQLQHIETKLGISLPEDYREFLRDYGGFWPADNQCPRAALYYLNDYGTRASISSFYTGEELLEHATYQWENLYIPKELISIGEDGNVLLFLAVAGRWKGTVYQWYPPGSFFERLYYYPDLEVIARSFSDFIEMLQVRPGGSDNQIYGEKTRDEQMRTRLEAIELPLDNRYSAQMSALNARYVYSTLGEKSPRLSDAELKELEKEIGFDFPLDYREFLRDFSGYSFLSGLSWGGFYGAFPELSYNEAHSASHFRNPHSVRYFHGYMRDDLHSLWGHFARLRKILPQGVIPIADGGGVCLSLTGEDKGTVYIGGKDVVEWRDEFSETDHRFALVPVASSFDEFMGALKLRHL